jgi:glutamate-1-semialdehyde 2,1-aminomutase
MANGFSLSALVGKGEIMERGGLNHVHPRVFLLSTTNGAETHCLAASLETIRILKEESVIEENWRVGRELTDGFNSLAAQHGIAGRAVMKGPHVSPWYAFYDAEGRVDLALRTLFLQETIRNGLLMPYVAISAAHRGQEVSRTLQAVDLALKKVAAAIEIGSTEGLLEGPVVKPVFRKFN